MFIKGLASIGLILFSAGMTYFMLTLTFRPESLMSQNTATTGNDCSSSPIEGELIVTFSDEIPELMQDRIFESYAATVTQRRHLDAMEMYLIDIHVDPGKEDQTRRLLSETAGVIAVEQPKTACPS